MLCDFQSWVIKKKTGSFHFADWNLCTWRTEPPCKRFHYPKIPSRGDYTTCSGWQFQLSPSFRLTPDTQAKKLPMTPALFVQVFPDTMEPAKPFPWNSIWTPDPQNPWHNNMAIVLYHRALGQLCSSRSTQDKIKAPAKDAGLTPFHKDDSPLHVTTRGEGSGREKTAHRKAASSTSVFLAVAKLAYPQQVNLLVVYSLLLQPLHGLCKHPTPCIKSFSADKSQSSFSYLQLKLPNTEPKYPAHTPEPSWFLSISEIGS